MPGNATLQTKTQGSQSWVAKQLTGEPTGTVPPGFWT